MDRVGSRRATPSEPMEGGSVQVHWRHPNELSEEIRQEAEARLQRLANGHSDLIDTWIDVALDGHHRKGHGRVAIRCQARGTEIVAHGNREDAELALHEALVVFEREVKRMRERRKDRRVERTAGPTLRGVVDRVEAGSDHGFLITDAGERVYFHRNALAGGLRFDALQEGETVALEVEAGRDGLQATVVVPAPKG
jgi:ribosome-associated translation inhibitor RaiA/cold shock CspA family protein